MSKWADIQSEYYRLEAAVGSTYVDQLISPEMMERVAVEDAALANLLIEQMVGKLTKTGVPFNWWDQKWVGVTGHDTRLDSVIGVGYRGFRPSDFVKGWPGEPERRKCVLALVPVSAIPKLCDKPGCEEWARYRFGLSLNTFVPYGMHKTTIWGKGPGDELYSCPPHAQEIYRQSAFLPETLDPR